MALVKVMGMNEKQKGGLSYYHTPLLTLTIGSMSGQVPLSLNLQTAWSLSETLTSNPFRANEAT